MRLRVHCTDCLREQYIDSFINQFFDGKNALDFTDSNIYEFTCENGHDNLIMLQNHKYELCFDTALGFIDSANYREAIVNANLALELFYMHFINVCVSSKNKPQTGAVEAFTKTWKLIKGKSERLLGAYCILFATEFSAVPPTLKNTFVEKRNKAVHAGWVPSRDDAFKFCEEVYSVIKLASSRLCEIIPTDRPLFTDESMEKLEQAFSKSSVSSNRSGNQTLHLKTVLSFSEEDGKAFEDLFADFQASYKLYYS